jgi:hypothetical protein
MAAVGDTFSNPLMGHFAPGQRQIDQLYTPAIGTQLPNQFQIAAPG